jgi:sulfur-oxidizing protein SoxA
MRVPLLALTATLGALLIAGLTMGAAVPADDKPVLTAKSGYDFLAPDTQALQNDEFGNPGMLWVEEGETLWSAPAGTSGKSCASCHQDAATTMKGVAARYPAYSPELGRVINLEQRINYERQTHQGAEPLQYESEQLLAFTAFISRQSKGLPQDVKIDGPAADSFARGKAFFYQRRGQLNLACNNCHEEHAGDHLRGESISQGQVNGMPIYRALWQTMGSTNRMFAWCNEAVRAEPYPAGSQEYVDLELFERWRGQGLPIETPGVRR